MASRATTRVEAAYEDAIAQGRIERDPAQADALTALARLENQLTDTRWFGRRPEARGVYLHGPVGRGKTWLMDLFYRNLASEKKLRRHFHAFMREEIHAPLKRMKGQADPLPRLAQALAGRVRVICFDEFLVEDIADAMLLGPLFQALFAERVALVATANVAPRELYRDGLQRERFLPAIAALEKHCEIVAVAGARDYRAEFIGDRGAWRVLAPAAGDERLAALFERFAGVSPARRTLEINDRDIAARGAGEDTLFMGFAELCEGPRSAADYLEIARRYRVVLLADVPVLGDEDTDAARRFIALVDILYESHAVLIAAAAAPPESLYRGRRFRFEFKRTTSRLEQMQSAEWLAAAHLTHAPALTPL